MSIYQSLIDLFRAVSTADGGTDSIRVTNVGGSGDTNVLVQNALVKVAYDYIDASYPSSTQEVYTYKTGGSGGTAVAVVTVNYSDSSKNNVTNVSVA